MHTVSTYPYARRRCQSPNYTYAKDRYKCSVGYSGHETGLAISYAAAALGINFIRRHITLDRAMYGSDQSASIEPSGLAQLVGGIRKIEKAMGDGEKRVISEEIAIARKLRGHLFSDKKIVSFYDSPINIISQA